MNLREFVHKVLELEGNMNTEIIMKDVDTDEEAEIVDIVLFDPNEKDLALVEEEPYKIVIQVK